MKFFNTCVLHVIKIENNLRGNDNLIFPASLPVMENPPMNVTVLDGKDATIQCRAFGAPTPNVTWVFVGK